MESTLFLPIQLGIGSLRYFLEKVHVLFINSCGLRAFSRWCVLSVIICTSFNVTCKWYVDLLGKKQSYMHDRSCYKLRDNTETAMECLYAGISRDLLMKLNYHYVSREILPPLDSLRANDHGPSFLAAATTSG